MGWIPYSPLCPFGGFAFLLLPTLVFGIFRLFHLTVKKNFNTNFRLGFLYSIRGAPLSVFDKNNRSCYREYCNNSLCLHCFCSILLPILVWFTVPFKPFWGFLFPRLYPCGGFEVLFSLRQVHLQIPR